MSWDINRVVIAGRLTKDPETKFTPAGKAVCNCSIAVGMLPQNGVDKTSFIDITVWGKAAETLAQYQKKGGQILLDGHIEQQTWTDKDGGKRSKLIIVAERVQFIGGKKPEAQPEESGATLDDMRDNDQPGF
jgi:single-strand DNA-binding protein